MWKDLVEPSAANMIRGIHVMQPIMQFSRGFLPVTTCSSSIRALAICAASELEGCRSNADETEGQLAVTAIQSAGDVHEIKELNSSAEVGALCVAVVRQSLNQVSSEIWGTTRGGAAVVGQTKSLVLGGPTGVSPAGALRVLRRYARGFAPRGGEGVRKSSEACLVLYCKLAGGVVMASPLDGPAFRVRQQLPIVEDEEALAGEATETQLVRAWVPKKMTMYVPMYPIHLLVVCTLHPRVVYCVLDAQAWSPCVGTRECTLHVWCWRYVTLILLHILVQQLKTILNPQTSVPVALHDAKIFLYFPEHTLFLPCALAQPFGDRQTQTCWTLPSEGFEALLDLENSVVPGLPALARDMSNDERLATKIGRGLTPLAEEISFQLYGGDENRTKRVVVPRVAGIIFASLDPAAASTTSVSRGSTSVSGGGASLRVTAVLARLEQGDGGTAVHRFVLEDFDVFGDGGAGMGGSPRKGRRPKKIRSTAKGRATRRVPLPTTYATLLEEATSPRPPPGNPPSSRFGGEHLDGFLSRRRA